MNIIEATRLALEGNILHRGNDCKCFVRGNKESTDIDIRMSKDDFFATDWEIKPNDL